MWLIYIAAAPIFAFGWALFIAIPRALGFGPDDAGGDYSDIEDGAEAADDEPEPETGWW